MAIKDKITDDEFKNIQEKLGGLSESKPARPQYVRVSYAIVHAETNYDESCGEMNHEISGKICHAILEIMNIPDVCIHHLPEECRGYSNLHKMFHQKCKIASKTIEKFHTATQNKTFLDRMSVCHYDDSEYVGRSVIIIQDISEPF